MSANEVVFQLILETLIIFLWKFTYEEGNPCHVFKIISFPGRNALHLAAKYGHALCLQKLLQVVKLVNALTFLL